MKYVMKIHADARIAILPVIPKLVPETIPNNHSFDPTKTKDVVFGKNRAWPVPKKRGF